MAHRLIVGCACRRRTRVVACRNGGARHRQGGQCNCQLVKSHLNILSISIATPATCRRASSIATHLVRACGVIRVQATCRGTPSRNRAKMASVRPVAAIRRHACEHALKSLQATRPSGNDASGGLGQRGEEARTLALQVIGSDTLRRRRSATPCARPQHDNVATVLQNLHAEIVEYLVDICIVETDKRIAPVATWFTCTCGNGIDSSDRCRHRRAHATRRVRLHERRT